MRNTVPKQKRSILTKIGLLLIVAALVLTAYNIFDQVRAGRAAHRILDNLVSQIESAADMPDYMIDPEIDMPVVEIDGVYYVGKIEIPAENIELPVCSEWSYANLRLAPCRYSGSPYMEDMVIAGHNYRSHFGPLARLGTGADVIFTDAKGNKFNYVVAEIEILQPTDVKAMKHSDYPLTLFTCTLGGRTRCTVRCDYKYGDAMGNYLHNRGEK